MYSCSHCVLSMLSSYICTGLMYCFDVFCAEPVYCLNVFTCRSRACMCITFILYLAVECVLYAWRYAGLVYCKHVFPLRSVNFLCFHLFIYIPRFQMFEFKRSWCWKSRNWFLVIFILICQLILIINRKVYLHVYFVLVMTI